MDAPVAHVHGRGGGDGGAGHRRQHRDLQPRAYSVSQRRREIGLRIALGAPPHTVTRLIVKEGMTVAMAGIGAGVLGAMLLARAVGSLVYAVAPRDPATFAGVAVALALVAFVASALPARRAARVDPMVALREE
ncbi:MAG: hypothetical protein DMF78_23395 [Acidobacteria bacterium]|nr:MAG: hypothetical protein DMF78_23395 [Acidobacteriota bacterium]